MQKIGFLKRIYKLSSKKFRIIQRFFSENLQFICSFRGISGGDDMLMIVIQRGDEMIDEICHVAQNKLCNMTILNKPFGIFGESD